MLYRNKGLSENCIEKEEKNNDLKEFFTVEEETEEENNIVSKNSNLNPNLKSMKLFSHCYLNEQKTHLKSIDHPQKNYNLMKIRKY